VYSDEHVDSGICRKELGDGGRQSEEIKLKLGVVPPQKYSHSVLGPVHLPAPAFNVFWQCTCKEVSHFSCYHLSFLSPSSTSNQKQNKKAQVSAIPPR